jgi:cytochrome b subunit of formate dehydrogenase
LTAINFASGFGEVFVKTAKLSYPCFRVASCNALRAERIIMEKTLGQKIAYVIAIACYLVGAGGVIWAVLYQTTGPNDVIHASMMASVVFFVGCGVVLHVIATTRLKGLISGHSVTQTPTDILSNKN